MDATAIARGKVAGVLTFAAGFTIWMGVITAEALYPAVYTTNANEISDLGSTRPPDPVILQPSATIFDVTMLAAGAMILAAAWFLHRAAFRRSVTIAVGLLGLGVLGVGMFPGNHEVVHPIVAMLAFTAGGIAAIAARKVTTQPFRTVSVVLGTIALGTLVAYSFVGNAGPFAELGDGGVERWVAYPTVAWLIVFGGYLMTGARTGRNRPGAETDRNVHPRYVAADPAPPAPTREREEVGT